MTKKSTKRRRYTAEFKAEVVRLVEQRGDRTVGEIAQSLGVTENMLHAWKRQPPHGSPEPSRRYASGATHA